MSRHTVIAASTTTEDRQLCFVEIRVPIACLSSRVALTDDFLVHFTVSSSLGTSSSHWAVPRAASLEKLTMRMPDATDIPDVVDQAWTQCSVQSPFRPLSQPYLPVRAHCESRTLGNTMGYLRDREGRVFAQEAWLGSEIRELCSRVTTLGCVACLAVGRALAR